MLSGSWVVLAALGGAPPLIPGVGKFCFVVLSYGKASFLQVVDDLDCKGFWAPVLMSDE